MLCSLPLFSVSQSVSKAIVIIITTTTQRKMKNGRVLLLMLMYSSVAGIKEAAVDGWPRKKTGQDGYI